MFVYNHTFRNYLHYLKGARLSVLMALSMHANNRNRCYPSQKYLAKETGHSISTVNSAISWLKEVGGIEVVPYDKRVGDDETSLPVRQHVYQLTGAINVDGMIIPYMYDSKSESQQPQPEEITDEQWAEFEITVAKILATKILMSVTKVIPSLSESIDKCVDESLPDSGESQQPDPEPEPSPAAAQKPKPRISDQPPPKPLADNQLQGVVDEGITNTWRAYRQYISPLMNQRSSHAIREYVQEFGSDTVVQLLEVIGAAGGTSVRAVDRIMTVYREHPDLRLVKDSLQTTLENADGKERTAYLASVMLSKQRETEPEPDTPKKPRWKFIDPSEVETA